MEDAPICAEAKPPTLAKRPRQLLDQVGTTRPDDGGIYQVITEGKGQMGPLGGRIPRADRWAAVAWVRVLQRARQGTLEDVPEADREGLR